MKLAKLTSITGIALIILLALPSTVRAQAQTLTVLHTFTSTPDGALPLGRLLLDPAGNLYGTTTFGGTIGYGSVFKVDPNGNESVFYSFAGPPDGNLPTAGLARDAAGNLFGVTLNGGSSILCPYLIGCGIVFKLDPAGTETVLHRFGSNGADGTGPQGRLILDNSLNLFGTTGMGGHSGCKLFVGKVLTEVGCGTVFKVDANGNETILYSFTNTTDGAFPLAGLAQDTSGNLFGTASTGGVMNCAGTLFGKCGTVFKVDTARQFSMLYSFQGASTGPDGGTPTSSLLLDATGNLIGTTRVGGTGTPCFVAAGCGTIFQVTPAGKETLLHSFTPGGAATPADGLVQDAAGNFYGLAGGNVFKLDSTGKESVLFTFTGNDNLASGELVQDSNGNLYGTTYKGGANFLGTVFKLTTPPDFAVAAFALTPATVAAGGSATSTLDLITVSGFNDTMTFACSVSPSSAQAPQCSVNAASGTPATVTVTTSGPSARATSNSGVFLSYALWLPLLGLVGIGSFGSKQRRIMAMLLGCVLCVSVASQVACGGGSSHVGNPGTPAGSYTITVTGTSGAATGSLVRSTSATLQVQ